MEEETTVLTEQAEAEETSDAFDEGWAEMFSDGMTDDGQEPEEPSEDSREPEDGSEEEEADADQQNADETEGDSDGAESKEKEEGEEAKPDQAESFDLKYLGESKTVNRDEVIRLAQQGMDYPRIKEKWEAVKDDVPKLRMYESFLQELAETRGGDIESLIDETRTRSILAKAKAAGKEMAPSAAAAQAVQARLKAMEPDEAKKQADLEEEQMARRRASVDRFLKLYGSDIKAEDIPAEVWAEAETVGDLTTAYQKYNSSKQEAEIKRLKAELEQAKQQNKNRERSMGSSKSAGNAAAGKDPFLDGWDDAW